MMPKYSAALSGYAIFESLAQKGYKHRTLAKSLRIEVSEEEAN
jgi:hypothetical protein